MSKAYRVVDYWHDPPKVLAESPTEQQAEDYAYGAEIALERPVSVERVPLPEGDGGFRLKRREDADAVSAVFGIPPYTVGTAVYLGDGKAYRIEPADTSCDTPVEVRSDG